MRDDPLYQEIRKKHAAFHAEAEKVLKRATDKQAAEASRILNTTFDAHSHALASLLTRWKSALQARNAA